MRKNFFNIICGVALASAVILPSCNPDSLTELNTNPNQIDYFLVNNLFTSVELALPIQNGSLHQGMQYTAFYKDVPDIGGKQFDYLAGIGFGAYSGNTPAQGQGKLSWLKQCMDALTSPDDINKLSVCRILRVYVYHVLTDVMGDIPYSEALNGKGGNFKPKYDTQQFIYNDMLKELDEASAALTVGKPTFGSADVIYNGDVAKWK
jgi:hypothetical protein